MRKNPTSIQVCYQTVLNKWISLAISKLPSILTYFLEPDFYVSPKHQTLSPKFDCFFFRESGSLKFRILPVCAFQSFSTHSLTLPMHTFRVMKRKKKTDSIFALSVVVLCCIQYLFNGIQNFCLFNTKYRVTPPPKKIEPIYFWLKFINLILGFSFFQDRK